MRRLLLVSTLALIAAAPAPKPVTPSDIIAARANRIRSVAVYTGISTEAELRACQPDVLLEDLRQLKLGMVLGAEYRRGGGRV